MSTSPVSEGGRSGRIRAGGVGWGVVLRAWARGGERRGGAAPAANSPSPRRPFHLCAPALPPLHRRGQVQSGTQVCHCLPAAAQPAPRAASAAALGCVAAVPLASARASPPVISPIRNLVAIVVLLVCSSIFAVGYRHGNPAATP